jgi:hypothetical protein
MKLFRDNHDPARGRQPHKRSNCRRICVFSEYRPLKLASPKLFRMILLQNIKNNCPGMILLHKKWGEGPPAALIVPNPPSRQDGGPERRTGAKDLSVPGCGCGSGSTKMIVPYSGEGRNKVRVCRGFRFKRSAADFSAAALPCLPRRFHCATVRPYDHALNRAILNRRPQCHAQN